MRRVVIIAVLLAAQICVAQMPGDDCSNPIVISYDEQYIPYFDGNFTCGRGNSEQNTCLKYYDGGEDIFYEINLTGYHLLHFQLNPLGTTYTGLALGQSCPPAGSEYADCLAYSINSSAQPHGFDISLEPGTYYLMIDTWPSPDCIPAFELTIVDVLVDVWGTCIQPLYIALPYDAPYEELNQSTCSTWNNYTNTCLGYYDGGNDIIYLLEVSRPGKAIIRLDPKTTGYTGIALGNNCPPLSDGSGQCLGLSTSITAQPHGIELDLTTGEYYLIIDTWPAPDCIPEYDLSIVFQLVKLCGDANDDLAVNVSDAVYLINHIFVGGEAPVIYGSGDVNCDDNTNISDAVWIINYIFIGGNAPCDIDGDGIEDC